MASNTKSFKDPQGQFDDWIELYNPTQSAIDLSGMYITDDERLPKKWKFPAGTSIGPGGYLVLWADEDTRATPGLHLNFKLSASGEDVYLLDTDDRKNAVIDHVRFEKQTSDVSIGRHPRSQSQWEALPPTAGLVNRTQE